MRYSIGNVETLGAAAVRRAARAGEPEAVPRVCDLPAVLASSEGRVEFDTIEEGREDGHPGAGDAPGRARGLPRRLSGFDFGPLLHRFDEGLTAETSDLTPARRCSRSSATFPASRSCLDRLGVEEESPGVAARALEFALEGLHLSRRLNKDDRGGIARYASTDEP